MGDVNEEFCYSDSLEQLVEEKKKRGALHSIFPKLMGGTEDKTKYVLVNYVANSKDFEQKVMPQKGNSIFGTPKNVLSIVTSDNDAASFNSNDRFNLEKEHLTNSVRALTDETKQNSKQQINSNIWSNSKNVLNFDNYLRNNVEQQRLDNNQSYTTQNGYSELGARSLDYNSDSLWYDDGHLNVTFRNDVLGVNDFAPYKGSDRQGCKRRCIEMLNASGEELSGELIRMTINGEDGIPKNPSKNFQMGIDVINRTLDSGAPIILNVDHRLGNASSADGAGDHFIIVVGKTVIDGKTYYHFYDPATSDLKRGTANRNVLQIKDGYLTGDFITGRGKVKRYKVTSVRLNKKKQFKKQEE